MSNYWLPGVRIRTHPPARAAAAMSRPMDKRMWRALCDDLGDQLAKDQAELDRLAEAAKVVRQRMAATRLQLDEMTGRAPHADVASSSAGSDQSTLDAKRARIAAVRSFGVQVPDDIE